MSSRSQISKFDDDSLHMREIDHTYVLLDLGSHVLLNCDENTWCMHGAKVEIATVYL